MSQCHGIVTTKTAPNYDKRCTLIADNDDCFCKYHKKQRNNKNLIVRNVTFFLNAIEKEILKINKIKITSDLYDYLLNNIEFIKIHEKFKNIILNKLNELQNYWTDAKTYKQKILNKLNNVE